ncbi:hypothetical protein LOAG_09790 [Loa loa]|uniref:Uncharacterized protein n=1 Tax=Loa loa TaxID=7209 RepID=A0A1S0TR60_LOALO|nr:hypothetical protein LOAG_09790 [Loa loa]EFO18702.1 hypothetical protein LOAG_09790 [Loa loa]
MIKLLHHHHHYQHQQLHQQQEQQQHDAIMTAAEAQLTSESDLRFALRLEFIAYVNILTQLQPSDEKIHVLLTNERQFHRGLTSNSISISLIKAERNSQPGYKN